MTDPSKMGLWCGNHEPDFPVTGNSICVLLLRP